MQWTVLWTGKGMAISGSDKSGTALLVANYPPDVGFAWWLVENFWVQFAEIAREHGMASLVSYPSGGDIPKSVREAGIEVVLCPFPGDGMKGAAEVLQFVRKHDVKCVYFTDRPFSSWIYSLLRLSGVRLIINHDHTPGDRPDIGGAKGVAKSILRRAKLFSCDLQICVSPLIRERAILNARIPPDRTVVVQNGIEPIRCERDPYFAHRTLGIPEAKKICISVGRAHPYKRVDFAISIAEAYVRELGGTDLAFVHCGDGPDLERLKHLVSTRGLEDHFVFAGRREDVHRFLCSASIALHPAKGEAFSLAILEYMSAGLPVLVPDIPTVRQAVRHGETGMVYPDGDVMTAARFLSDLVGNEGNRLRLGARAKIEAREKYSMSSMNENFQQVIAKALATG